MIEVSAAELCADCTLAGAWDAAQTYALRALSHRTDFFVASTKLTLWYETEALVRAGEIERATADVRRYGECIGESRRYRIPYVRALAVFSQHADETGQAIEYLQEAASLAEDIELPGELWLLQAALGESYLKQGDAGQAHRAFVKAATVAQGLAHSLDDGHRSHFLTSPLIQRIFNQSTS